MKYKNDFKVVGYFFAGKEQNKFDRIRYDLLTHINFAFAIPKRDGTLLPLENPEAALRLVKEAHENNCTAGLASVSVASTNICSSISSCQDQFLRM